MVTLADIAAAAQELGARVAKTHAVKGIVRTAEDQASRTALGTLFDGSGVESTPHSRTIVNIAFRLGYATN